VLSVLAVGIPGFSTPPIGPAGNNQPDFLLHVLISRVLLTYRVINPLSLVLNERFIRYTFRQDAVTDTIFLLSRSANALAVTFFDACHYILDPNHQFGRRFE
jgi:hypothetical protein